MFYLCTLFIIIITASSSYANSNKFKGMMDETGHYHEGFDLSGIHDFDRDNRRSHNILEEYLNFRLEENLFHRKKFQLEYFNPLLDPFMKYPLIAISSISLSMMIIFLFIDIINWIKSGRSVGRKRILNMFMIGIIGSIGYIGLYLICHSIKLVTPNALAFFPHFYPYFLGTIALVTIAYFIIIIYSRIRSENRNIRTPNHKFYRNEDLV